MSTQRIEVRHNEPEQVREYLIEAQKLVADHVKAELRSPELLVAVLQLVAAKSITETRAVPQGVVLGVPQGLGPGGVGH
jgi:hypothetical protein